MTGRIIRKDLTRNKVVTLTLFYFILIAALLVEDTSRQLTVSGIYQDLTNGGRTAKAMLPWRAENVQWYLVYLDLN